MKKNIRIKILCMLLPALVLLLAAGGCKKAADPPPTEPPASEFWLTGKVTNAQDHTAIANAKVYFAGQAMMTTDASGMYRINCRTIANGTYDVRVVADGFGYGFASATVSSDDAMVNIVALNPLAAPVSIGTPGGTVTLPDPECLTPGGQATLVVPANALAGNVNLTFTRLTGINVPGLAPPDMLNLCTVNIGPAGTILAKPMELRIAMPFTDPEVTSLPLMRYDFDANTWLNTGIPALVDPVSNTATVLISVFGTYSLAVTGGYSESNGTPGSPTTMLLDPAKSYTDLSYQAAIEYPSGTPATISASFLKNIASQNTTLNGIRTSFSDYTVFGYNYIGTKPDSLAPVKSSESSYYRWVPKVNYASQDMPVSTSVHGLTVSGIIQKQVYAGASIWQYVHDQGGGGKK